MLKNYTLDDAYELLDNLDKYYNSIDLYVEGAFICSEELEKLFSEDV